MSDEIFFDGRRYISANEAASSADLTRDYIARLCRDGKVTGRRVGKNWYVDRESLNAFLVKQEYSKSARSEMLARERIREYHGVAPVESRKETPFHTVPRSSPFDVPATVPAVAHASHVISGRADEIKNKLAAAVATQSHGGGQAKLLFNAPGGFAHAALTATHVPVYALTPLTEFFHKVTALALALMLTFGTYAAVDPSYARFAANSVRENVQGALDSYRSATGGGFGELAARTQSQMAAAAEHPGAAVASVGSALTEGFPDLTARLARALNSRVNGLLYSIAFPFTLVGSRSVVGGSETGSISVEVAPYTPKSTQTVAETPTRVPGTQTIVTNPVVERVIETTRLVSAGGITEEILDRKLAQLDAKLSGQLFVSSAAQTTNVTNVYAAAANVGRIEHLDELDLTNPTITNGTITGTSITNAGSLSVSGGTTLATTTINGDLTVNGTLTPTTISATNFTAVNGTTTNSTSTNLYASRAVFDAATSTNFFATNASTTNATSTNLYASAAAFDAATSTSFFSTLARFTTGIVDTLTATLATITSLTATNLTATNATTTNAYATNQIAQNFTSYSSATAPSFTATSTSATSTFAGSFSIGTSQFFVDHATGRVGVGTTSPSAALAVSSPIYVGGSGVEATSTFEGNVNILGLLKVGTSSSYISNSDISTIGNLTVTGTTNLTGLLSLTSASTSLLSVFDKAYFGGTATSTFDSTGTLTLVGLTNSGLGVNASGQVYAAATTTFSSGLLYSGGNVTNTGVLSLTQNGGGAAQTGALTFATSSATTFNGLSVSHTITNSGATFTFGTPSITGTLDNAGLTNSTISGIALGSSLANLTATDGTLTFSGAYNGGTARTIGLNLGNANAWTALQQFGNASTTLFSSYGPAYFGGSATTTIDSAGNILGTGTLSMGTSTLTNLAVTNTSTSTFAGPVTFGSNLLNIISTGQVALGTASPNASALLQLDSTARGFLPPRLTTVQKSAIASPAAGLTVFDTTVSKLNVYNGTAWKNVGATEINGEVTSGTTGSVLFVGDGGVLGQDNANFFYATSTSLLSLRAASSTQLSVFSKAYFGGTATSTFDSTGALTLVNALTYGGVTLSNAVTGTGNMVLSASPALTGTLTAAAANFSGLLSTTNASTSQLSVFQNAYFGATATSTFDSTGFLTLPSGFLSQASSTIGNGTQTGGLTISGGATTTGNAYFAGNVGIGTASPNAALTISNSSAPQVRVNSTGAAQVIIGAQTDSGASSLFFQTGSTATNKWGLSVDKADSDDLRFFQSSSNEKMRLTAGGKLGIGTTSPYSLLSISNSASTAANTPLFTIASTTAGTATSTLLTVLASGNVGIGTASPSQPLQITSSASTTQFLLENTTPATSGLTQESPQLKLAGKIWNSSSGNRTMSAYLQVAGVSPNANPAVSKLAFFVGTDGSTPTEQMSISSAGIFSINGGADFAGPSLSDTYNVKIRNTTDATSGAAQNSNKLLFESRAWNSSQGNVANQAYIQLLNTVNNANPFTERLGFFTQAGSSGGASTEQLSIVNSGNVGIGTTSPYAKLSVVGQAVAEYFTATSTTASVFPYASSTALTATSLYSTTASTTDFNLSGTATLQSLTASSLLYAGASKQLAAASVSGPLTFSAGALAFSPSADVSFNSNKITSLTDPTSAQDAATKNYVDATFGGNVQWKQSVRLATAAALPTNIYANGVSGVGATLTATANAALSVDSTAVAAGNRILVKNESTAANNGIYTVTQTGSGVLPYILTRATDYDQASEMAAGDTVAATEGSTNIDTFWLQTTNVTTVGTDSVSFSEFGITYTAGSGLSLSSKAFSLNTGNANSWTALQQFGNASTTLFSSYGPAYFGATATSSFATNGALTLVNALTYGGVTLSNAVTGTGNMVLSASPTLTGTLTAATANFSGLLSTTNASTSLLSVFQNAYFGGTATSTFDSAGNLTLAGLGTAAGSFLAVDTTGKVIATTTPTSGGTPGGTNTQLQYNNNGVFGGMSVVWNATNSELQPGTDNTVKVGTSTARFAELNAGPSGFNTWNVGGASYEKGSLAFSSNILKLSTAAPVAGNFRDIQIAPGNSSGLYLSASGPVGLGYTSLDTSVGNSLLVSGRIGIGTTTPGGPLIVVANGRATGDLRYGLQLVNTDNANSYATNIAFAGGGGTGASTGNFFIGTDSQHNKTSNFFIATSTGTGSYQQWVFNGEGTFTIGDTGTPSSATNKLYSLGGALYWNGTNLTGGVTNYWARSGSSLTISTQTDNVGVGATSTPGARLAVAGSAGGTTPLFMVSSSTAAFATTTVFQLDQNGTATLTGALLPGGTITNNLAGYDLGATGSRWNALWAGALNIGTSTFSLKSDANSNLGFYTAASGGGTQAMTITSAGNIGIGTTSPYALLAVGGDAVIGAPTAGGTLGNLYIPTLATAAGTFLAADPTGKLIATTTPSSSSASYTKRLAAIYSNGTAQSNQTIQFGVAATASGSFTGTLTLPATTTEIVVEVWGGGGGGGGNTAGGAGGTSCFGTNATACTSPTISATGGSGGSTNGSPAAGGAGGSGSSGNVNLSGAVGDSGDSTVSIGGIGGAAPRGGGGGASNGNGSAFGGAGGGYSLGGGGGGGGGYSQKLVVSPSGTYYYTTGAAGTAGGGAGVGGAGGIVITVYATSTTNAAGNDYAEMFPVSNPGIGAGDIVAVDAGVPVSMTLARSTGSGPLAGIISTNPGQTLGDINAAGERPVALSGRVPAKVNLENGPINIGDRIAPSSVPGVGKKAGIFDTSVGIAMEPFDGGDSSLGGVSSGIVTVFMNIQTGTDVSAITQTVLTQLASSTATMTNWSILNATSTVTDELCLGGDCVSSWASLLARGDSSSGGVSSSTFASLLATTTSLASTLAAQGVTLQGQGVTLAALQTGQAGLVSTSSLNTTLGEYVTFADLPSPVTLASLSGTVTGDIIPTTDNTFSLGSPTNRFTDIYAQNINAGDLTFTETTSAISGDTLAVGDMVSLFVTSTAGSTHTIPINLRTAINSNGWNANNIFFNTSGSFGIGIASTTALKGKLDVEGAITTGSDPRLLTLANTAGAPNAALPYSFYIPQATGDLNLASNDDGQGALVNSSYSAWKTTFGGQSDAYSISRSPSGTQSYASLFNVTSAGKFGIGSSTPNAKFAVQGTSGQTYPLLDIASSTGASLFSISNVGTLSLANALTVANGGTGATTLTGLLQGNGTGAITGITGTAGQFPYFNGASTLLATSTIFLSTAGNVGIGTTSPFAKFSISANNGETYPGNNLFLISSSTASATTTLFSVSNTGVTTFGASGGTGDANIQFASDVDAWMLGYYSTDKSFRIASSTDLDTNVALSILKGGWVGIGTTSPFRKLSITDAVATAQVAVSYDSTRNTDLLTDSAGDLNINPSGDDVRINDDNLWVCSSGSCPSGTPAGTGNLIVETALGVGTSSPSQQLGVAGMLWVGANGATGMGTATSTFYGDIRINGKLDVGTIDPVYTIDGMKFATYGHSTVGIKEETMQTIQLAKKDSTGKYAYIIDFDSQKKGSDLWLFYQITDFGDAWQNLVVVLTPAFDGKVFYKKMPEKHQLIVYGNEAGEVSMRLSGNRFDFSKWGNLRPDQDGDTTGTHVISGKEKQ